MTDMFPNGIPLSSLGNRALELGRQLDTSPLIPRDDPAHLNSQHIEADEALAALRSLDNWSDPQDRAMLKKFATILGVEVVTKKMEWQDRTPVDEEWTTALLDAVPVGQYIFISDRRKGVMRYDTVSDVWSRLPKPWDGYHRWQSPAIAELDGKLAIVGTYPRQTGPAWGVAHLYDPETGAYTQIKGVKHRTNAAMASHGGKLYIFGGSKFSNEQSVAHGTPVDHAQVYDPATNKVNNLPALPVARYGAKAVTVGDKIYVIGGRGTTPDAARRVDVFDPASGQWQEPYQLASPRTYPTVWVVSGQIHISSGGSYRPVKLDSRGITGVMAETEHRKDMDASTEILDPAAEGRSTRQGVPLPIDGKQAGVAALVGDALYVVALQKTSGGMGRGPTTQVLAEVEEPAPTTVINNVTNNVDNSVTVVNDIDVILTSITETTEVSFVEVTNNNIEINNEVTNQVFDIDVLNYQSLRENRIAVDIDANFFCRPSWNGQPLMSVGHDGDGKRYLYGIQRDGRSALPKDSTLWLCQAGGQAVELVTDGEGRFAAQLPAGMSGTATIARVDADGHGIGAQIELP